jgi:hypothetical protein
MFVCGCGGRVWRKAPHSAPPQFRMKNVISRNVSSKLEGDLSLRCSAPLHISGRGDNSNKAKQGVNRAALRAALFTPPNALNACHIPKGMPLARTTEGSETST